MPLRGSFDYALGSQVLASLDTDTSQFDYWWGASPIASPSLPRISQFDYWWGTRPLVSRVIGTSGLDYWAGARPLPLLVIGPIRAISGQTITQVYQTVIGQYMALGLVIGEVTGSYAVLPLPPEAGGLLGGFSWWQGNQPIVSRAMDARSFDHWQGNRPMPLMSYRVATMGGTIFAGKNEVLIRAGSGGTIEIVLTGDQWKQV